MLSIVILHYNRTDLTDRCLQSVRTQEPPIPHEVLVLDNGSDEHYTTYHATVHRLAFNVGNITGQNMCFDLAKYPWVLFVSNDVRLRPGCVARLWEARIDGQLMPMILDPDGTIQSVGGRWEWPGYGINQRWTTFLGPDYVPSICYLMPKAVWQEVRGFDDTLPMAYEDVDFGLRLGAERLAVSEEARATHLGNATLRYGPADRWRFHQARCQVIRKHYHGVARAARLATVACLDGALDRIRSRSSNTRTPYTA